MQSSALRPERGVLILIDEVDRSWLRLDRSRNEVTQGGPRRMWDEIEDLFETWCRLGAPNREHFGLTVTVDGRHTLWLDKPGLRTNLGPDQVIRHLRRRRRTASAGRTPPSPGA